MQLTVYNRRSIISQGADGVLVPGGFGRGEVEGEILAAKYARENNVPYLGICLGMQVAVIELARSVLGVKDANNTEFDGGTRYPCLIQMPEVTAAAGSFVALMHDVSVTV